MYCTNCGKKIPEKAVVCTNCGAAVSKTETKVNKGMDPMQAVIYGAILFGGTFLLDIIGLVTGVFFIALEGCGIGMIIGGLIKYFIDKRTK